MSARKIRALARRLEAAYGRRGWWPTTPRGGTEPVYRSGNPYRRKTDREILEICVGAVLTQNTAWSNVRRALTGLLDARLLSIDALRAAPVGRIERAIRPSGYFRAKARKLRALARFLTGHPPSRLRRRSTPELRAALLGVHGVGPETADDICCYAFDRAVIVADAYTRRILSRIGALATGAGYEPTRAAVEAALPADAASCNEFHARVVELAKQHCRTTPVCRGCPARAICDHRNSLHM